MKKINAISLCICLLALLGVSISERVWAADGETVSTASAVSNRSSKRLGADLAVGEPAPSLIGINVAYNVFDFMRATAGYGNLSVTTGASINNQTLSTTESSATTIGFGTVFMVPGWSLTPTGGLHFANISYSGEPGAISVGGFKESGSHLYLSAGADWQSASGFNVGLGLNQSLKSGIGTSFYLSAGWFFNIFG